MSAASAMAVEESEARALRPGAGLRWAGALFLAAWLALAVFPLLWIGVMSVKLPLDAFAADPWTVLTGPGTRERVGGPSAVDLLLAGVFFAALLWQARRRGWGMGRFLLMGALAMVALWGALPMAERLLTALEAEALAAPLIGFTWQHYEAVWVENGFYRQFFNSLIITAGVVCFSLTIGVSAGYALARTGGRVAFWLLAAALLFRALPHSVLVSGYLQPFLDYNLYGSPLAVVLVLAAINQPFTIWMLRSFFANIPAELDEAALVDGCTRFEAFWRVIMPVMWPGVITTGLFSFLLAYNDYLVAALLLDAHSMTMVPSITQYFNRETTMTDQTEAIAAAVSITAPLFVLVLVFQKQIVSGLVQGAVKG